MIILEVSAGDLVEHLQQILMILVNPEQGWVCCVEVLTKQVLDSEFVIELFKQKQAAVRRKIATVEIYPKILVAFQRSTCYNSHGTSPLWLLFVVVTALYQIWSCRHRLKREGGPLFRGK